jgi:hypothetical protein
LSEEAGQEFVRFANAWKTVLFFGWDRARCKTFYALGPRTAKKLLLLRRANEFLPSLKSFMRAALAGESASSKNAMVHAPDSGLVLLISFAGAPHTLDSRSQAIHDRIAVVAQVISKLSHAIQCDL